jgi:hypothetical protein
VILQLCEKLLAYTYSCSFHVWKTALFELIIILIAAFESLIPVGG